MRYVILGAGAIGCAIGGRLFEHGHEVVLVARGAHLAAIASGRPRAARSRPGRQAPVATAPSPAAAGFGAGDVAVLATKTQHSEQLLAELAACAPSSTPVVCAQNGVENERLALRRFPNVQAMCVFMPATHLEPGVVEVQTSPLTGLLDLGPVPLGHRRGERSMAADLNESSFDSIADPE